MEDVVTEAEGSVLPLSLSPTSGNKKEDDEAEDDKKVHKYEGVDGKVSGSRNNLFPRLMFGSEAEDEKEKKEEGKEQRGIVKEGKEEEKGGGIITDLISNVVSPPSPQAGEVTELKHEVIEVENGDSKSEEDVGVGGHGGGIINNLISNLFHQGSGGEQSEEDKEAEKVIAVGAKKPKKEDEGEEKGGGGIIDSIVSHLPTSLPGEIFLLL